MVYCIVLAGLVYYRMGYAVVLGDLVSLPECCYIVDGNLIS